MSYRLRRRLGAVLAVMLGAAGGGGVVPAAIGADLLGIRFGTTGQAATRIVFDLSGPVEYAIHGDPEGSGRLRVDFSGLSSAPSSGPGKGHVASFTIAPSPAETGVKAQLDFARAARIRDHFILSPKGDVRIYRLVIDLETADKAAFLASLPQRYGDLTEVLQSVSRTPSVLETPIAAPTVVIDAGHGGSDPGATSSKGVAEKTVTLAAALKLSELLQAKGRYRVVLTRADDTRKNVEERAAAAREAGADLFISLHADAHKDEALRGGSVYTLSQKGTERSEVEAKARGENEVYALNLDQFSPDVSAILYKKAQTVTLDNSAAFAEVLLQHLDGVAPMLNKSHRVADLRVLLSPDVPAVLLELAFISNAADAVNLTSPEWRARTMAAVADAIDAYFSARTASRRADNGGSAQR